MNGQEHEYSSGTVQAQNVGGIEETEVRFSPGVTILVGRNATNRTSFLQAVMAALGSENVAIKGDADEATVKLTLDDRTYSRYLQRSQGSIVTDGDPYLDDSTLADLFAFILESNEARRAVTTGQDLRDLIMRPVDTDEIQREIEQLVEERESLKQELAEIEQLKDELPELEEQRTHLEEQIEDKRVELEEKEAELDNANASVKEKRQGRSKLEEKLEELRTMRSKLDDTRYDLETEREGLEAIKQEHQELSAEQDALPDTPMGDIDEVESDIRQLRQQKQQLEAEVNELQSVIGFNEEMLKDAGSGALAQLVGEDTENVTDQLLADDEVTCWTCGSTVNQEQIKTTVSRLRELSRTKVSSVNDIESEISDRQAERRELKQVQRERDRIERRLSELTSEIEQTEETIRDLQARRDELTKDVEAVEAEVEELESEDYSEVLDLHKEANQLEYELGKLETDLDRVESDIADIESTILNEDDVEAQIDQVDQEIEDLRTKIERIEQGAVKQFNEHMDTVLEMLDYDNLDRIWLERVEREVREGRRKVTKSAFELHVIRTSASGAAYEDTVDHLSESEREVTGLVFALAGYLAHEVYEDVPFILLDSLEAIDSERIAALVEYLTDYTSYLLVALLPEDATALSDDYERITEI